LRFQIVAHLRCPLIVRTVRMDETASVPWRTEKVELNSFVPWHTKNSIGVVLPLTSVRHIPFVDLRLRRLPFRPKLLPPPPPRWEMRSRSRPHPPRGGRSSSARPAALARAAKWSSGGARPAAVRWPELGHRRRRKQEPHVGALHDVPTSAALRTSTTATRVCSSCPQPPGLPTDATPTVPTRATGSCPRRGVELACCGRARLLPTLLRIARGVTPPLCSTGSLYHS